MSADEKPLILIIEDVESITKLFKILIGKIGFDVISFKNGEEACRWLDSNRPAAVICDIMLPGISGEMVLEHIRTLPHGKDLEVLAVTALAMEGDRERLLDKGFNDYISKPIDPTSFVARIKRAAGK